MLGLLEEYVSSPQDVIALLHRGEQLRSVSRTDMNEVSSRSHTVCNARRFIAQFHPMR